MAAVEEKTVVSTSQAGIEVKIYFRMKKRSKGGEATGFSNKN